MKKLKFHRVSIIDYLFLGSRGLDLKDTCFHTGIFQRDQEILMIHNRP